MQSFHPIFQNRKPTSHSPETEKDKQNNSPLSLIMNKSSQENNKCPVPLSKNPSACYFEENDSGVNKATNFDPEQRNKTSYEIRVSQITKINSQIYPICNNVLEIKDEDAFEENREVEIYLCEGCSEFSRDGQNKEYHRNPSAIWESWSEALAHMVKAHSVCIYKCDLCSNEFFTQLELELHLKAFHLRRLPSKSTIK